ncbi:hypothetical protein ACHAXR_009230 [Thalassiosira sp. AJA248-18]
MKNHEEVDASRNHVERIMKQEEPEKDHPPQSLLNVSRIGSSITQNNIDGHHQNNNDFDNNNHGQQQLDSSNIIIMANHSRDSNDSVDQAHSTVGSTVSIMGSVTGEGDYSSTYDEARLLAVKRRMMQDVEEALEEDDGDDEEEDYDDSKTDSENYNEDATNSDTIYDNNVTLNTSADDSKDILNVSLECNADTDTSLLEDYPLNEAIHLEDEELEQREGGHRNNAPSNVVKVADFSNPNKVDTNNIQGKNNESTPTIPEEESPFRAAFRRSTQGMSNHLSSQKMLAVGVGGPAESLKRLAATTTPNKFHKRSASSALDKAATTASLLPQLARQCFSFEDTTVDDDNFLAMPDHFHVVGGGGGGGDGGSATHKYYGLSAVASFATSDHDDYSSTKHNKAQTKGLPLPDIESSAAAPVSSSSSRVMLQRNTPRWHPPHRTRLSYGEQQPTTSPFRVIRQSQTWDHHGQSSSSPMTRPMSKENPKYRNVDFIRQSSSFDPWSPPSVGRGSSWSSWKEQQAQPLGTNNVDALDFRERTRDGGEQKSENKNWKKIETERGDAIDLLAFMVEQSLNFEGVESEGSHEFLCEKCQTKHNKEFNSQPMSSCDDCLEKMKCIANSIKDISADSSDKEQLAGFNHQIRSTAIDTLLRSYEFALEAKRSSLSANKWLEIIGSATNNVSSEERDEYNQPLDGVTMRARLHSAENAISSKHEEISRLNEELSNCRAEIGRLKSGPRTQPQHQNMPMPTNKSILSNSSSDESMENSRERSGSLVLCSPRPAVKTCESHDESFAKWEKNIEMQMNLESRKEILFLKAQLLQANQKISELEHRENLQEKEPFSSEIEPIKASSDDGDSEQLFMRIAEDIEKEALDTPISYEGDDDVNDDEGAGPAIKLDNPALEKELDEYRSALITSLRADENGRSARADSITSSEDPNLAHDLSKSNSSDAASDRKMINVRMIDGENFSTEWGDMAPDLPPPPDHDLHSPIVDAILSKWTDDPDTRSALIGWIENILNGSSTDSMPSLKLSGLDHQIRDGFIMHVLPLLLRRKDVHVHLTSRAHRQTSYDIAVSVRQSVSAYDGVSDTGSEEYRQISRENKHHLIAFQATRSGASIKENIDDSQMSPNKQVPSPTKPFFGRSIPDLVRTPSNAGSISTAVTSPISNRTPSRGHQMHRRSRYTSLSSEMKKGDSSFTHGDNAMPNMMSVASPSLGDDLSVGSSVEDDTDIKHSQRQSSIMGSISGAFGLLSRRKPSAADNEFHGAPHSINDGYSTMFQTPKREANHPSSKSPNEEEHPYHRVLSAPPGKIGITFVDYRGHAMVSNVSEESPLAGWVYPSDVLIAIDDVPVSGLRTRDIVKLLTDKVGQQRNLRMVSAVAMNELTRPGTV